MPPGLLILDTNCYAQLESPDRLARLRSNLRVANLIAQPTELNLVEVTATAQASVRERLLATVRRVADGNALLPWPFKLLQQIGEAMARGQHNVAVEPSGKEWYLEDPAVASELRDEIITFQRDLEKTFSQFHARNRKRLQEAMKSRGVQDEFGSAREFLESFWSVSDMRRDYAEVTWSALSLPGKASLEQLTQNESWKLLLDAEGVAVYERAIARVQPKIVQRLDLIQLVYLGLARRRIIATADNALLRAADAVLLRRYENARAIHVSSLL